MSTDGTASRERLREMCAVVARGDAILFTGAGFSGGALDRTGVPLPDSRQMRAELWALLFGEELDVDDSTLQDLYDVALERIPDCLSRYLGRRLQVGDAQVPPHYATWFSAPWRRIYTLNVDDLELAVQRQVPLPRRLVAFSQGDARCPEDASDDELAVVHLNGLASQGAHALTFSTFQYAARLCNRDRDYAALARDMASAPFVFAGTTLDEIVMWQHLELHRRRAGEQIATAPSWLLSPSLSHARRLLLDSLGVRWIPTTIEAAAELLPTCRAADEVAALAR
jgi:hypothetical protein